MKEYYYQAIYTKLHLYHKSFSSYYSEGMYNISYEDKFIKVGDNAILITKDNLTTTYFEIEDALSAI